MENLGIDIKLLLAQTLNFILFYIVVKKFVAKPFLFFLNEEKNKEKEKQKLLVDVQKQEASYQNKEIELRKKLKDELDERLKDVKIESQKIKEEIIAKAENEAKKIKNNAQAEIKNEIEALNKQIKNKVSNLSLVIVNEALKDVLDDDSKKKVTKKILSSLPKNIDFYEN